VWRERVISGLAAGTLVLGWFIVFDGLTIGNPWYTVERVGGAIGKSIVGGQSSPTLVPSLLFFCVIHYVAWIANASVVLGILHRGEKQPTIIIPILLLNGILYVPFIGVITIFVELGWGSGSWVRFIVGALIGGVTEAALAYRAHRDLLRYELAHIDDDD
jgi:hypothetical protein